MAIRMRLLAVFALAFFCNAMFSFTTNDGRGGRQLQLSISEPISMALLPIEEKDDGDHFNEIRHSNDWRANDSNGWVKMPLGKINHRVVLAYLTYCVGNSLYLAHRSVLI